MLKFLESLIDFYSFPLAAFREEKEPQDSLSYRSFKIRNFRGLTDVSISFARNDLILLLGLNESGKTSILRAIDAFDFSNDPEIGLRSFFTSMREKKSIRSNLPCTITAEILVEQRLRYRMAFGLPDSFFVMLPGTGTEIETMFSSDERVALCKIALRSVGPNPSKDEFLAAVRTIMSKPSEYVGKVKRALSDDTKGAFETLLRELKS